LECATIVGVRSDEPGDVSKGRERNERERENPKNKEGHGFDGQSEMRWAVHTYTQTLNTHFLFWFLACYLDEGCVSLKDRSSLGGRLENPPPQKRRRKKKKARGRERDV
jgi:hypothetical protein